MRTDHLAAAFAAFARAANSPDEPADVGPVDAPAAGQGGNHKTLNPNREPVPSSSTLNTQHSTLNTQHSTLNTQRSTLNTQHSTLNTQPQRGRARRRSSESWGRRCRRSLTPPQPQNPIAKPPQSQNLPNRKTLTPPQSQKALQESQAEVERMREEALVASERATAEIHARLAAVLPSFLLTTYLSEST